MKTSSCWGRLVALALLCVPNPALAEPIVTIDDGFDSLPDEAFFAANPTAVVNVESGGFIVPGEMGDPFDFSGATVNVKSGGAVGTFFGSGFLDNVEVNIDGGLLEDRTVFSGATGETLVTLNTGSADGRLEMQGNSRLIANGGVIGGGQPFGLPSLHAQGSSRTTIDGAAVDDFVLVEDSATVVLVSGSIGEMMDVTDDAVFSMTGGSVGPTPRGPRRTRRSNINGGVVGREFTALGTGTVNFNGGGLEQDAGNAGEGVFNIRGGAVEEGFRAFDGKVNLMGGVIGDRFRLGSPANPSEGNVEIFATSATIDGVPIAASRLITEREGQFLSVDLALDGTVGLSLTESGPVGSDVIMDEATLTLTLVDTPGDFNGDGLFNAADYTVWRDNKGADVPLFTLGDADGSGGVDDADYLIWAAKYGASLGGATAMATPEPAAWLLVALSAATAILRRG